MSTPTTAERPLKPRTGRAAFLMQLVLIALFVVMIRQTVRGAQDGGPIGMTVTLMILSGLLTLLWTFGYFVINPGDSRAILFFGTYRGTVRDSGFHWVNPFCIKRRVTLRARSLETGAAPTPEVKNPQTGAVMVKGGYSRGAPLKVNDRDGNPIEIAAVVVWKVVDTAKALFSVDDYERFVAIQSESALRNLASQYHYDLPDDHDAPSLRGSTDLVGQKLREELHQRVGQSVQVAQVVEDHLRRLASALKHQRLEIRLSGEGHQTLPRGGAAGEGEGIDILVHGQCLARRLTAAGDHVQHTRRQAGIARQVGQPQTTERGHL